MNFDKDVQDNGKIDVLGVGALELDKQRLAHDKVVSARDNTNQLLATANQQAIEKKKLDHQKEMQDKDALLKQKELANKLEVEAKKQKQIETQNASQEKIAKEKHQADMAIANKQLELKDKDIELKKVAVDTSKKTSGHEVAGAKHKADTVKDLGHHKVNTEKALGEQKVRQTKAVDKLKLATQKKLEAEKVKKAKENKPTPKK